MAGVPLGQAVDGCSFTSVLSADGTGKGRAYVTAESFLVAGEQGEAADGREGGHGEYVPADQFDGSRDSVNLSLLTSTHRFIFRWRDRPELYDLTVDPYEHHNVADQPGMAPISEDLRQKLAAALHGALPTVAQRLNKGVAM